MPREATKTNLQLAWPREDLRQNAKCPNKVLLVAEKGNSTVILAEKSPEFSDPGLFG
jgi:hypothetical protein